MATHFQIRTDCFVPIEMIPKFSALVCRLSPENLYMDGEADRYQVERERRAIDGEWRVLERKLGFAVTYEDACRMCR